MLIAGFHRTDSRCGRRSQNRSTTAWKTCFFRSRRQYCVWIYYMSFTPFALSHSSGAGLGRYLGRTSRKICPACMCFTRTVPRIRGLAVLKKIVGKRCPGGTDLFRSAGVQRMARGTGGDLRRFLPPRSESIDRRFHAGQADCPSPTDADRCRTSSGRRCCPSPRDDKVWLRKISTNEASRVAKRGAAFPVVVIRPLTWC